jgi:hypothetical protein
VTGEPASGPRLPAHYEPAAIDTERHAPWLIASLLEEGDTPDLRWLVARYGRRRLASWVAARGSRQLSRRSLEFWRLVLEVAAGPEPPGGELWPR